MKRVDGKLRLSVFALAIASAFATTSAVSQEPGAETGAAPDASSGGADFGGGGGAQEGGMFSDMGFAFSGFLRFDSSWHTDEDENPNNQRTNPFNGRANGRSAFPANATGPLQGLLGADLAAAVDDALDLAPDQSTAARNVPRGNQDWNLNQLRGKFDLGITLGSNMQIYSSIRTVYDFGNYDEYDPDSIGSTAGGFNQRKTRYFEYDDYKDGGSSCLNYLEICGNKYMADFTALYLDVTAGPILVRAGQQQIAWGQALFFRIFDVPNGLDLRRHLILDDALEEYADERVAAPGVRVTWQVTDQWEADAYAQMFTPTTYPNPNTPYNVIPSQFSVHETWSNKHRGEDFNYGLRLRANFGNWGLQAIATQRYNQEGTFRWIESGENTSGLIGGANPAIPDPTRDILADTPLEIDPSGVWSANEWFTFAGQVRLDGVEGLNILVREFQPATGTLGGAEVGDSIEAAARELDLFFTAAGNAVSVGQTGAPSTSFGGLRGHIIHEYHKEEIYGLGASYVVEAEPGSLLDQLIINVETSYIPERKFTQKGLSRNFIESDESVTDLVMEKYHRWFDDFPATYMVFQAIHKSDSNLFGQHLGCQGGTGGNGLRSADEQIESGRTKRCGDNKKGGSTDVVLAFLQPFPNYIYRLTGAALLDIDGGLLVQGGFRWSPGNDLTFDFIYNHINGNLYGDSNENALQNIDWADEFFIRAAIQF